MKSKFIYKFLFLLIVVILCPQRINAAYVNDYYKTKYSYAIENMDINFQSTEYGDAQVKEVIKYTTNSDDILNENTSTNSNAILSRTISTANYSVNIKSVTSNGIPLTEIPYGQDLSIGTFTREYSNGKIILYFCTTNINGYYNIEIDYETSGASKVLKDTALTDITIVDEDEHIIRDLTFSARINKISDYSDNFIYGDNVHVASSTWALKIRSDEPIFEPERIIVFYPKHLSNAVEYNELTKGNYLYENDLTPMSYDTGTYLIIGILINLVLLFFALKFLNRASVQNDIKEKGDLVKLTPLQASRLVASTTEIHSAVFANLLDLKRRGIIDIREVPSTTTNKAFLELRPETNFLIEKKMNSPQIYDSEKYLLEYLLSLGNGNSVTTDLLYDQRFAQKEIFETFYKLINDTTKKELVQRGILYPSLIHKTPCIIIILICIASIITSIVAIISKIYIAILAIVLSLAIIIFAIAVMAQSTSLGKEQTTFYQNISISLNKMNDFSKYNDDQKRTLLVYKISYGGDYKKILATLNKLDVDCPLLKNDLFFKAFNIAIIGSEDGKKSK